jgi:hypothetical protein
MPDGARCASPPLLPADIQRLLQGIFTDPAAPPELAIEAFAVTAASLYDWCNPAEVDLALRCLRPTPVHAVA